MLGIDSQAHGQVHCFIELGELYFLQQRYGILQRIRLCLNGCSCLFDVLSRLPHCFPCLPPPLPASKRPWCLRLRHGAAKNRLYAVTSIPIERAVPFTVLTAASRDAAFKSGSF